MTPFGYLTIYAIGTYADGTQKAISYETGISLNAAMPVIEHTVQNVIEQNLIDCPDCKTVTRQEYETFCKDHPDSIGRTVKNTRHIIE